MKTIRISLCVILCTLICAALLPAFSVRAASSASLSGSTDIRAGDTVKLTFRISGTGLYGLSCRLSYNDALVKIGKIEALIASPWIVESQATGAGSVKILAYDNALSSPIDSRTAVFSVSLQIKESVTPGTSVSVSVDNIAVSDGVADQHPSSVSWSAEVREPRSSDASLSSLVCKNAPLSPAFSPSVTRYSVSVPYSVASLQLVAETAHAAAVYKVGGNTLAVGTNLVLVTVTAEDGTTLTYQINVTRQQDPSYVPSSDASLKSLQASAGVLSPSFDPAVTDYVLYLPHEVEILTLLGTPNHDKGSVPAVNAQLTDGLNVVQVVGTAEDGTKLTYTVQAVRMPPYTSPDSLILPPAETEETEQPPQSEPPESLPPETAEQESTKETAFPDSLVPDTDPIEQAPKQTGITAIKATAIALLAGVLGIGIGFGCAMLWKKRNLF